MPVNDTAAAVRSHPVLPLHDDNPTSRPAIVTWLIIAACLVAYFLWQPTPFSDDTDDVVFNLAHAAIAFPTLRLWAEYCSRRKRPR